MLRYKALKVAADEGLSCETFKASHSWCRRSMRRHKPSIRARTRQGQTLLLSRLNLLGRENTLWVTCSSKERATALLLGDCHGNKYPPFLIFKSGVSRHSHIQQQNDAAHHGFGVRLWKEVSGLQSNYSFRIYSTPTAWWNSQTSPRLLEYHFAFRENMGRIYSF
ncbi:hypothetical protein PHMEG_00037357 [Phytophthora megakarya]|uniref:HTH CENPB-type domain-containing protein n=1 Tax=Phytophthora megakarya TaxID=4795 RepID=A0A225UK31_9STRA|nr:hypothetical protein PHMEG_00037357 [Phytophthora megakarya]